MPKQPGIDVTSMSDELDPRLTFAAYLGTLLLAVVEGDDYWLPLGVSLETALTRERMEEARHLAKVLLGEALT